MTSSNRPAGLLDIGTALAPYAGPWNARLAAHLLRRAGFGGSPQDIVALALSSMHAAVDGLIHFSPPGDLPEQPEMPDAPDPVMSARQPAPTASSPAADAAIARQKAQALFVRDSLVAMQTWWLERMLRTSAPLQEKMALFWHGHFTTLIPGKGATPAMGLTQNQLFRRFALGNIHQLTQAVARDPAMLFYLDNALNVSQHPNENFSRELMELFTLGIGNYTERDVREGARAFTGWRVRRPTGEFFEAPRLHDDGQKAYLGRIGNFDGGDAIDIIFTHPAAARFFAQRLLDFFVYNDPEPELIEATAALLRKNQFEVAPVMSILLRSNAFYSQRAYRALVKSPVEFTVGTYRLYGVQEVPAGALGVLNRLGQSLFQPPSVKGWDGGRAWLNSGSILMRENFAAQLVRSPLVASTPWLTPNGRPNGGELARHLLDAVVQGDASPASAAQLAAYLDGAEVAAGGALSGENYDERVRGAAYLAMVLPAYQLN